ncbi:MAG: 7, 8-dihydropterin-6-methyl-4-(beta-D-ribofuranosyl)- aminobenzene-5'-phosphate synthase [Candidatus Bathyarchaeota archaeon BA2]|nr:MAG: 7, 8-dihydropterin-6-methyl-4-(beta-D-ribofuranosyl)- aminobenzene-5'-phosphate synthase [Candidatus Bathyarchaeota archaeon BA2]
MLLQKVDRVEITILVDNVTDMLIQGSPHATRAPFFKGTEMLPPLRAEHGFSALIDVYLKNISHRMLFDTGACGDVVLFNVDRLGVDLSNVELIVLSHGHFDHSGGLMSILKRIGKPQMPVVLHPDAFLKRWVVLPTGQKIRFRSLEEDRVLEAGAKVVKIAEPYPLLGNLVLATGEIPRRTQFEQGFPAHYAEIDGKPQPDPLIRDDQALVMNVKGKGLVIISGCAHAGIINTVLYAREVTRVNEVYALMGGFHLSFPNEFIIDPTVEELKKIRPTFIVPCHDTGWKATNVILNAMPENFIPSAVGTTFIF